MYKLIVFCSRSLTIESRAADNTEMVVGLFSSSTQKSILDDGVLIFASSNHMLVSPVRKLLPRARLVDGHLVFDCSGDIDSGQMGDIEEQDSHIGEFPRVKVASGVKLGKLFFELEDSLPDGTLGEGPVSPPTNKLLDIGYCPR